MGWIILLALMVLILGGLMLIGRLPRRSWEMAAAILMLGAAGYAWQGRPMLAGSPREATSIASMSRATDALLTLRSKMDRHFGPAKAWLIPADGMARAGDHHAAAAYIKGGLRKNPQNADLWNALGVEMMLVGEGQDSPAATLAFERARALDPRHPGPDYFTGLIALGKGEPDKAVAQLEAALAKAGPNADWAPAVTAQLAALKQMQAAQPAQ